MNKLKEKMDEILKYNIKRYFSIFTVTMIFAIFIYSLTMKENLVNHYDGLWNYSYRMAGYWELSIGRWFLYYLDRIHFGLSIEPISSIIALIIISLGMILILNIFNIKNKRNAIFINFLFLSNVVVCVFLTYRYESLTYAISFFLSILAAFIIIKIKRNHILILLASILIAIMMGCYQANIGCTCIVLLSYLIYMIYNDRMDNKDILVYLFKSGVGLIIGGIIYIILLKLHLNFFNVILSKYNNANSYSIINSIIMFPSSIIKSYKVFYNYFVGNIAKLNVFQLEFKYIYILIIGIFGVLLLDRLIKIWNKNKVKAFIFIISILIIPIACNSVLFIATDSNTSIQMTAPLALLIPLMLCIISEDSYEKTIIMKNIKNFNILLLIILLYGSICMIQIDQNAMLEGRIATTTMAQIILNEIKDEEYLTSDKYVCFIGRPSDNELFKVSNTFYKANQYAKFGEWSLDTETNTYSWRGLFNNLLNINLNICGINNIDNIKSIPNFPEDNFIFENNDIVFVKISNIN